MRTTRRTLRLLALEDRLAPAATVSFASGSLNITGDNTSNTVVLSGQGGAMKVFVAPGDLFLPYFNNPAGTLAAIEGNPANNRGTFNLTGNINVTMGNSQDFVLFVTDDGGTIPGNITVSLGNSNDAVIFATRNNTPAFVNGFTTLNGGIGADNFFIDDTNFQNITQIIGGGSGIRNDASTGNQPNPNDVFESRASSFSKLLSVNNAIAFLGNVDNLGTTVNGDVVVSNQTPNPLGNYQIDGEATFLGYSGVLAIGSFSNVTGNVTYAGSTSADNVSVFGTINGKLTVANSDGLNTFDLGRVGTNAGTVNGSLSYIGGSGVDSVSLPDGSTVNGSVTLNMFDGANTYDLDNSFTVGGVWQMNAGTGNDVATVGGFIGGNQYYNLGAGNNNLTWNGISAASNFNFQSGGGNDALTINGINSFALYVLFGAGDDTFTYGTPAAVGSAYIDFGAGNDVYNDGGNTITWPQTIVNL